MSAIEIPIILVDVLGMIGSGWYYNSYIKGTENEQQSDPNIFMKCLFPGCTVCAHQGCDNMNDVGIVFCLGPLFTVGCWEPKNAGGSKVYAIA
jgi:hypothetical protein